MKKYIIAGLSILFIATSVLTGLTGTIYEKDKIVISKASPSLGEAREELDVEYKGKEIAIGFNPGYIIDLLKNTEQETINFELVDPDKPGVVRVGSEYVYVVMPRQLD